MSSKLSWHRSLKCTMRSITPRRSHHRCSRKGHCSKWSSPACKCHYKTRIRREKCAFLPVKLSVKCRSKRVSLSKLIWSLCSMKHLKLHSGRRSRQLRWRQIFKSLRRRLRCSKSWIWTCPYRRTVSRRTHCSSTANAYRRTKVTKLIISRGRRGKRHWQLCKSVSPLSHLCKSTGSKRKSSSRSARFCCRPHWLITICRFTCLHLMYRSST